MQTMQGMYQGISGFNYVPGLPESPQANRKSFGQLPKSLGDFNIWIFIQVFL
jgi:hypothetical protein